MIKIIIYLHQIKVQTKYKIFISSLHEQNANFSITFILLIQVSYETNSKIIGIFYLM